MIITRKAIPRRTVLRGLGAALALPLLDSMTPALRAAETSPLRWHTFYTPNGMIMEQFIPAQTGAGFEYTPILKPLESFREQLVVITGLAHGQANPLGDGSGDHGRSTPCFLTGVHPKKTEGSDIYAGISADQMVARQVGKQTQIASLELGIDPPSLEGSCDTGYSCAYTNTLSWRAPTSPMPVDTNPREVYERLFGDDDSLDQKSREARLKRQSSILDFIKEDAATLSRALGPGDKHKMDEYLESIRDVERRIQQAEQSGANTKMTDYARPSGVPASFEDHARVMIDLQVLALQADMTRVITFMLGREVSARSYPEIGVPDAHHPLSHHGNDPAKIVKLTKINVLHMEQLAYFLKRMSETKDLNGSLLDHTMVMAGASLGDPNRHDHMNLPIMMAGAGIRGNRHVAVAKETPMTNLLLSIMDRMGVPMDRLGDSTGRLTDIAG
jgi:hypothetical protein